MGVLGEFRHFRPSALAASLKQIFGSDSGRSRQRRPDRRAFRFEPVEPRLLLSADITPWNHETDDAQASALVSVEQRVYKGVATADTHGGWAAADAAGTEQVFWLSTEAAFDVRYDGPVVVDGIQIAAFDAQGLLEGQEAAILDALLRGLEQQFGGSSLQFTFERPASVDFSTIFIGEGASWFDAWGRFGGLAEQVDVGNTDKTDIAFVFTDVLDGGLLSAEAYGRGLAKVVAHEAGHLLGLEHAHDQGEGALAGVAFDPRVHAEIGKDVLADVAGLPNVIGDYDGKVTIDNKEYTVHPRLAKALDEFQPYFNAGTVAGDGFPDVLMGQFAIHPIEHGTWLTRILDMAWAAQGDGTYSDDQQLQILAWSYGFLTHSAGDHWAHTLVNDFAEGVAPGFVAAAKDARDLGNMLRHFMTEAYIADAMPGFDTNPARELYNGDYTDDSTPEIAFEAPIRFIYETLIRPFAQDPTPVVEMKWGEGTLSAVVNGGGDDYFERAEGSFKDDGFKAGHKIAVADFGTNSGTYYVTSLSPDGKRLFVSGALDASPGNGQASGNESIVVKVPATAKVDIDYAVAGTVAKFVRNDGGSFVADGFVADMRFSTHGFGVAVPGDFIVKTVSASEIVVVGVPVAASANGTGDEQLVVYGQRGPVVDGLFKLRDALYKKAVDLGTRVDAGSFGNRAAQVIEDLITGTTIDQADKDKLFHAYLYNWVDELDEGLRAWGEVGLAFSKAMFDPQSRRDLQNKVGAAIGQPDSADVATLRSKAEDGVGVLDVLIAELDDPNNDDSVGDGFINRHLLPMIGLPQELGMLRTVMVDFGNAVDDVLAPVTDAIDALVNPLKEGIDNLKDYAKDWIKKQIEERWGFSFEVFDYLKDLGAKMDLAQITLPGGLLTVPVFREGDHDKLDAILGLDAIADHHEAPPAGYDSGPVGHVFTFYPGAEGELTDAAAFEKTGPNAFAAYANSVTLTKMLLLMEDSGEAGSFNATANNQLSQLVNDVRAELLLPNVNYDYSNNNLHGAHGGNFLTTTLPGVAGDTPWMLSIDADQVWRRDNYTTRNMLFRIAVDNDVLSPASYVMAVDAGTAYEVYVTWQANVTQEVDDQTSSLLPDRKMVPAENAAYSVIDGASTLATVNKDQRLFPSDRLHTDGLSYAKLTGAYTFASGMAKISLSNLSGLGQNVLAGPVLLVPVGGGVALRIANDRSTSSLAAIPGNGYSDNDTYWDDVVYPAGSGNNPLWESDKLRPVFRALFDDYLNDDPVAFPDLGDAVTADPNDGSVVKTERGSHATPFGKEVADNTIEVPITDAVETFIVDGLQDLLDFANSLEKLGPLGIELPGIGKSLGELIDLSKQVDDNLRKPVLAYFAADTLSPTFGELFTYLETNSPIGASLDSFEGLLEFKLDLSKTFNVNTALALIDEAADDYGLEVNGALAVAAELAFLRNNLPSFVFGINLGKEPTTVAERLYIRADRARFQASVTVPDLDLGARFGFVGVGVVNGSLNFNAELGVSIGDGSDDDGRLTLAEFAAAPANEISFDAPVGAFSATLPIAVSASFLPATSQGSIGTVTVSAPQIFDPDSYGIAFAPADGKSFADLLNFKNIDSASLVGLLGQVTYWLDEFRKSDDFAKFDVPVLGPVLDDVLGIADAFRDKFLFDDGDDGVDGNNTLVGDLNAALASKGLSGRLHFEVNGKKLVLAANNGDVGDFTLETLNGDDIGFVDGVVASTALTNDLINRVTAANDAPDNGRVAGDVTLKIKLGSEDVVEVLMLKSATDTAPNDNLRIGNDRHKLVDAQNAATFKTFQELVQRLVDELGLANVLTYNTAQNTLDFSIAINEVLGRKDVSLNIQPDAIPEALRSVLKLQTHGMLRLEATGALNLQFGIDLGATGGTLATSDGSGDNLATLNGGVEISTDRRIVGASVVRAVVGALSNDTVFSITVDGQTKPVTVLKNSLIGAKTSDNLTLADLVSDVNAALGTAGLSATIIAAEAAGNLVLRSVDPAKAFALSTTSGDPLVKELGFLSQSTSVDVGGVQTIRTVQPALPATPLVAPTLLGRLAADASFTINLGVASQVITVAASATTGNRYAFDIVNDVQAAIDATGLTTKVDLADSDTWQRKVVVGIVGGKLTFTSKTPDSVFTITGTNAAAVSGLGLSGAANASDGADLVVQLRTGDTFRVDLDGAITLKDAIDRIELASRTDPNTANSARVDVAVNARKTGLTVRDLSSTGTARFMIVVANDSNAGIQLGIVGADYPQETPELRDGLIVGSDIVSLRPLDRFFIRENNALGTVTLSIATLDDPADGDSSPLGDLTAEGSFGFVGLKLAGQGSAGATLTLGLEGPDDGDVANGRVTFQQVLDNVATPSSLFDLGLTGGGSFSLDITPDVKLDLSDLGISVGGTASVDIVASFGNVFGGGADPSIDFQFDGFDDLLEFNAPGSIDLSFQSIVQGLQALSDFLGQFQSFGFLGDKLPVINVSINDLISIAGEFAEAVDQVVSSPAGTIQVLEQKLETAFGLPDNLLDLALVIDEGDLQDPEDDQSFLRFTINLAAGFDESIALELDVGQWLADETGLPDWITDSINFGGDANLGASGSLGLVLDFGIDLAKPLDVYVFEDTAFDASLLATATDVDFRAALGPFGIFVQDGDAGVNASIGLGLASGLFQGAAGAGRIKLAELIDAVANDPEGSVEFTLLGAASATLPVYFPTDSQYAGDVTLTITDLFDPDTISLTLPDGILDFDIESLSLLDQLLLGVDGVDLFLEGLQDLLDGNLGGVELPLIGDKLAAGVDIIGDFRAGFLEEFRTAIEQLANPAAAFNQFVGSGGAGFTALAAPAEADPVSKILGDLLGSNGLDILLDVNKDNTTDGRDIYFKTNLNQPGVALTDVFFDWDIQLGGELLDTGAGIGFDIGIPGLGLETEGDVTLDVIWSLDLGFGLSYEDGFYLDVGNDADEAYDDDVELQLNIDAAIPGASITGTLGFLQISAEDDVDDGDSIYTHLSAVLGIDIFNGGSKTDTKLGFSELGSIDIDVGIAAEAVVDLGMKLSLSSDLIPDAPTNFPSVVADFSLVWGVGDTTPETLDLVPLSDLDGSFLKNGLQYVGFEHVGLDLGSYFSDLIGPIVSKVQEITEPIKPFLDFLTADIPVISQLAGPTSLLDIAAQSGVINPGIIEAIEVVDQVVDIVDSLKSLGDAGNVILYFDSYLPSLVIYGQKPAAGLTALSVPNTPNIDLSKAPNLDELKKFADTLDSTFPGLGDALNGVAGAFKNSIEKMSGTGSAAKGFSLPIIEDPSQIFGMLLGQPATLVQFDMAPLILEADYSQFFPIYGPLGVSINAEFGAQFGPFSFGYDTLGITSFADGDFRNPWLLFDGFFVGDLDANGVDVPELQFDAGLWAAAELNLGVARGGVGGGLFAEIDFDLHDPDDDGRVRIKEMVANVYNEFKYFEPALAPLALFDITGKLTAELFAFLKVDLLLLQIDERWQLTEPITLLDFESNFTRVPTLATELGDGVLQLNMGKYAKQRIEGDLTDGNEHFVVKSAGAGDVFVWSTLVDFDGNGYEEDEAQRYNASNLILALGGEGNDTIDLSGVTTAIKFDIEGNAGIDIIKLGRTSAGALGKVLGGAGDDVIEGSDGADNIFGEDGEDTISGHGGRDWLFGDGKPADSIRVDKVRPTAADTESTPSIDAFILSSAAKATDDHDVIDGGDDEDVIFGGGGEDTLDGGKHADVILGDGGEVIVSTERVTMTTRLAASDPGRLELRVTDTNKGKGGSDTIHGDSGNDRLYGGAGDDDIWGDADDDVIFGEDGKDDLRGGANDDILFGDGGSFVFVNGALSPVVTSGGDADDLRGDGGLDKLLGGAGNDQIWGGADADDAWGGVGLDVIHGDGGNDHLYGGGDPDKLYGDAGDDYLEGGQGNDLVFGDSGGDPLIAGDDLLIAGYGSDTLDGEGGSDTYKINARGGSITDLTTAYDSGTSPTDTDLMLLVGTPDRDVVLLRAMADFYFPTLEKLIGDGPKSGLTDKILASGEADKLAAILQVLEDSYGPHEIPAGLVDQIIDLWTADRAADLAAAVDVPYYVEPQIQSVSNPPPTVVELQAKITEILATNSRNKLDEIREAIKLLWDGYRVPGTMLDAIAQAWQPQGGALQNAVETAIEGKYMSEALVGLLTLAQDTYEYGKPGSYIALIDAIHAAYGGSMPVALKSALDTAYDNGDGTIVNIVVAIKSAYDKAIKVPGIETDTAFVALINNGGKNIERFNYRFIEGLVVNTLQGEDYVASDDVAATTTINLGDGADKVQIGQVFRSERVRDPEGELITGIDPSDGFTTTEITRGWLSNGVSRATTVNGGEGNDQFTVFRNVATVNLNGNDGDDLFTVRAFALKGSSDNERARTDMKGDGGADTILYVVNAPVGIDGGDGFDTVRIVGTEFGDDFVVTDAGIFGAGLNVSYVNIEKLVADGAEGDDRFFVQSTGVDVVTEIDGGLGSDSFFVGGNPSRAPVAVISNDFKGHSGVILHSIESGDPAWSGVPVEGLSANVADNSEPMILVYEHVGITRAFENATGTVAGWAYDSYGIRLSSKPDDDVIITIVPAGLSPEDAARGFKDLEFFGDTTDGPPNEATALGFNVNTGLANLPVLIFTSGNWDQIQYINFRAAADTANEGTRTTFINHTAQNSLDQAWAGVQSRSVKVQLLDDDRDGVIVTPTKGANVVLEHSGTGATGFTDSIDVRLTRDPAAAVLVKMRLANEQITLSGAGVNYDAVNKVYSFTVADDAAWADPRVITITAPNDTVIEGLHTDYISFEVLSADLDATVQKPRFKLNGDFDNLVGPPLDIPADKPTSYLLLPDRPITGNPAQPISVWVNNVQLAATRFSVSGSTLTFLDANGTPQFVTGTVEIAYGYVVVGYDGSFVKDSVVDIYDEDAPMVIINQSDSGGSLDVVEDNNPGGQSVSTDSYRVRLTRAPAAGETVTFKFDAVETRTTYGSTALFAEQVTVNGLSVGSISFDGTTWDDWQTITVRAINDNKLDGNDTQVFAPDLQTVNKIRGPLIIEGAAGAGSLALPKPLMMPWELNKLAADGVIQAVRAVSGSEGPGAREVITVTEAALNAVVARLSKQDSNVDSLSDLKGKTLELSSGPGTGIVLNADRPDDLYDRFWLILEVGPVLNGQVELLVQNPSIVDPTDLVVTAPVPEADGDDIADEGETDFAITSLSINFFADEREQVDYVFIYDDDSVADDKGALTSSDGVVRKFESTGGGFVLTAETASLLAVAALIDPEAKEINLADLVGRQLTVTVGPGRGNAYTIQAFSADEAFPDGDFDGTKKVRLVQVSGTAVPPTVRSEFRIEGGDTKGRITGFGMGPNLLFAGRPQPGGITYGDIEVLQLNLGRGNDQVEVDYTTNAEDHTTKRSGDFYTLTMLDTGLGNDTVTVKLHEGDDGAFALRLNQGNDIANATGSTLGIAVFGEAGNDTITGGDGADTLFGDSGRIDYLDGDGEIVTRLGHYLPLQAKNPPVVAADDTTLTGAAGGFPAPDAFGGLVGLMVQAISPEGDVQFRRIVSHTTDTLTVDSPWDQVPNTSYYYRVSTLPEDQSDGTIRGPRLAWTIDLVDHQGVAIGGADTIQGGGGDDLVIGGAYGDLLGGGGGNDIVVGDSVRFDYVPLAGDDGPARLNRVETIVRSRGGNDRIDGEGGDDIAIGGTGDDRIDGGAQDDLVLGDNAVLDWNLGVRDYAERFRTLASGATTLYDADGDVQVGGRATPPGVQPAWAPWSIELDQSSNLAQFGNDVLAGGANSDMLFGQRGNDTIQGDGNRESGAMAARVGGVLTVSASIESLASDGDDYIEGNAGLDIIFGNLGQDDIIGGSSTLYSLSLPTQRDDDADLVFGGAGNVLDDLKRNADGSGKQGEDADVIAGDNANIYRVVQSSVGTSSFAEFAYDNDMARYGRAIVARAVDLVDYTPGNQDPLVTIDIGGADELHGESGDDAIYGMTGNDVLFGEGHDDDLIGGWGHDWISGGTGQDGVIGDDGRVMTSRNSATVAEPLHGIGTVVVGENISTPGNIQTAVLHGNGALKKTVNLTPFNVQSEAGGQIQDPLFRPTLADDIIFGGWGDDFLHGGAGDDAMLGGEARATGLYSHATPGNNALGDALAFDETRGEFAAYKEYTPRVRIQDFLLDFEAKDGVAIGTTGYFTDGNDAIFGDLGNDWLVGGTGRDNLYGGWGDDLLNADDDLSTTGGTNDGTDGHATYEDRAFGGAGRDVLLGNTGGDRLIDWAGEFNSYIVPFSPYGAAAISRALQPQLPEFLYKLSAADGADPTRATDEGTEAARNGEPLGELGLIRQQDAAWQDQTGAPADPQAGNFPGGPRDVLRSASFNTGQMEGLAPDSGSWQVSGGALQVSSNALKSDAVAVYHVGDPLPSYYEVLASIKVIKPTAGWGANSFIIFDYQSKTSFKFAGLDVATNKIVMGQRTSGGWQVLTQSAFPGSVKAETWFNLKLAVNGLTATLMVNNQNLLSYVYQPTVVDGYSYGLNWGMVGFGSNKSRGAMDNIAVQVVPPASTVTRTDGFTRAGGLFAAADVLGGTATVGNGRYALMPAGSDPVVSLADLGNTSPIAALSLLEFSATLNTGKMAGIVFDRYGPSDYKYAAIDVTTQKVVIGHRIGSSWVIDAQFSRTLFAGTDYTLGVTLRGASVSVTLDGQAVGGFVYNAVTVDGRFGVFARGASASLDSFTAKTNDDGIPAALLSGSVASTSETAATMQAAPAELDVQRLEALLAEAGRRWALVEDDSHLMAARTIRVAVADLDDDQLATYADGTILVDADAAGHGWFADASPTDDREFFGGGAVMAAKAQGPAAGRIDLLSVLAHEIGHAIGLGHSEGGVMDPQLQAGQRAMPDQWYAAARPARGPGASPIVSPWSAFEDPSRPAPTIDWGALQAATPSPSVAPAAASAIVASAPWQQRFVNHVGASAERLHPNAGFKLHLPAAAKVVPEASSLQARR